MPEALISSIHRNSRRFLRSTDLVRDFNDPKGLDGYWLTDFGRTCLEQIADGFRPESGRRAWRLTGDFGSGKSSFALLLANALRDATHLLPKGLREQVLRTLPVAKSKSFVPVLVTGSREPISLAVLRALHGTMSALSTRGAKSAILEEMERALRQKSVADENVLDLLKEANGKLIQSGKGDGVLLILDEVGKFLEFAALNPEKQDIYFLQQLAEMACRSGKQPIIVLCLLHQGFNAYAEQLAKATQQEWEKVAGRFEEILFHQPLDQITQLTASAIGLEINKLSRFLRDQAKASMEEAIRLGWYGTSASRGALRQLPERIFPLDPMLLPVIVRVFRRFGQNERSLFGFLCSHEPFGLQAFSQQPLQEKTQPYQLADFYDYVRANFGHRLGSVGYRTHWNVIESTIEAFQPEDPLELRVLKTVGILNLLNAEDLLPTQESVAWAVGGGSASERREVARILEKISDTPALYFRGKSRGYSIWAHTSVDIDARLEEAKRAIPFVGSISEAISLQLPSQPIVARAHYIKTGNLRYFDVVYCQPGDLSGEAASFQTRADGFILVPLCEAPRDTKACERLARDLDPREDTIRLVAVPKPLNHLNYAVLDAQRWEWVQQNTPELNNDRFAREEVDIHLREARYRLQTQVQSYLGLNRFTGQSSLTWFYSDHEGKTNRDQFSSREVLGLLSSLCDHEFNQAPLIKNELVNRHNLSSAAAAARMRLIDLMFSSSAKPNLGLPVDRKPPEKSMYFSVLKNTHLHREREGVWSIGLPGKKEDATNNVRPVLNRIKYLLESRLDVRLPITELMQDLRRPPFGLRDGLFPILLAVIAIDGEHEIAFYENGTFLRDIGRDAFLRMTKAPERFDIQYCKIEGVRAEVFQRLLSVLEVKSTAGRNLELLDVVKSLCLFVAQLPPYVLNTKKLSPVGLAVRDTILNAREPSLLLFSDLPKACGFEPIAAHEASTKETIAFVKTLKSALDDLKTAFPEMQDRMRTRLREAFDLPGDFQQFRTVLARHSEQVLIGVSESKLRAFCLRLIDDNLLESDWLESIGSYLALKPPSKWHDSEEDLFDNDLAVLATRFHHIESIVFAAGRSTGKSVGVRLSITQDNGIEHEQVLHYTSQEEHRMKEIQRQFEVMLKREGRLGLAAASRAILTTFDKKKGDSHE